MILQTELETYKRELPNLLRKAGKYALICGDKIASIWDTEADALQAGYQAFGLKPFLVKKIQEYEQVHIITRNIKPICRS